MHLQNAELRPVSRAHLSFDLSATEVLARPQHGWYVPLKAAADWFASAILGIPAGMLILLLATLVKLTSPGRAFYSQRRVGLNGRVFTMYKLRTMVENSEATTGAVWCKRDDPRVTRIGKVLRDTHLDELPQLWNVLRGQMSLIGPRPERPEIVGRLQHTIPNYLDRLSVRPGLTGLAQVQLPADSDDDSVRRKLACDRYYASLVSPWLDLRIALCTCLYLFSALLKTLCHGLVSSYKQEIERRFSETVLFEERPAAHNIG